MGIFEDILGRSRPDYKPVDGAFPELTPSAEDTAKADAAAVKEAQMRERKRFALPDRMPNILNPAPSALTPPARLPSGVAAPEDPSMNSQSAGVQLEMNDAPAGTGVPFSTQAGMLPPITTAPEPIPIPRPRPVDTDVGSRNVDRGTPGAPMQIAPQLSQAAPQQAPDPFGLPSILDKIRTGLGNNSNTLLALGAGLAGAPNIGQGISRAAAAAIPARAADIKQTLDTQSRTYGVKALIDAGVPVQQAIAAQGDPELKKALIKNYIEDRQKKIVEIGQDPNTGAKIMAEHDPFSGKLTPIDMSKFLPQGGPAVGDVTGPAYLEQLKQTNPNRAREVDAIVRGDEPFPTGRAAMTPIGRSLINDVYRVEPGTSETDFKTRQGVRTDYASGLSSRITKSLNTTVQHGAGLEKAITDLNNFSFAPEYTNTLTGAIKKQYDTKYQTARKAYISNSEPFVKELDFVLSGGKPTVSGQKELRQMFSIDASPEENMSSLHKAMDLLKGRLDSHTEGYNKGMHTNREGMDFIDPVNRGHFKRLLGQIEDKPTAAAPELKARKNYKMLPDGSLVEK